MPTLELPELPGGSCDAAEQAVLLARLVRDAAPTPEPIPADCSSRRAEILHKLGLPARAEATPPPFPPEPLRSKFTRLGADGEADWAITLDPALAQRLDAVLGGIRRDADAPR